MKSKRIADKHSKRRNITVENKINVALKSSFLGILFTAGISLAMLFASTAAALMTDDPLSFATPVGYAVKFASAFLGGLICSKIDKRSPYLTSALTGCGFVLLSMLFSIVLSHTLASGMNIWLRLTLHVLSFVTFLVGTVTGVKSSKPKRKIKKRR